MRAVFGLVLIVGVALAGGAVMIAQEQLIEQRQYREAAALWRQLCRDHPLSLTTQLDVRHLVAELEERARQADLGR